MLIQSRLMYQAYQNHMDLTEPWRNGAASALRYLNLVPHGVSDKLFTRLAAALELISRSSLTYTRPAYCIDRVMVGNRELAVKEEVAYATPFGSLLRFKKEDGPDQPKLLLVAPMSGHFATLLRGTVKTLLQDHDVYITDWHNPATFRSITANSVSTNIPSISSPFSTGWVRVRTWWRSASLRCPRSRRPPSCVRITTRHARQP